MSEFLLEIARDWSVVMLICMVLGSFLVGGGND